MAGGAWWAAVHGVARVGHDWGTSLSLSTFMHWRRKWQPTPVFLPGESQGRGSPVSTIYGVAQSRTRLKWLSSSSSSRALTNFIVNLAILLPYFLYHRLIFLCPPLNQLFSSCLSLLINYGNLLIHIPCIFIWKLHVLVFWKLYFDTPKCAWDWISHHSGESLNLDLFEWEKWHEMRFLLLSVVVQILALRVGNHRARKQPLYLVLLEDNDSRLRKWNWHWPKNG